jgi:DNA-binding MarR family transcriptional regulator
MDQPSDAAPARLARLPTWLLSQASLRAHQLLVEALSSVDARGYDYRLLAALVEYGAASQATLSRRTGVDRSDVVAAVNDLVERRYAKRSIDASDRRQNLISVTSRGRARYKRLDGLVAGVQEQLLAGLSGAEREQLIVLLRRILEPSPNG